MDSNNMVCDKCEEKCLSCFNKDYCVACKISSILDIDGICKDKCSKGSY